MRSYLKSTIKPLIPTVVKSRIVEVVKTQDANNINQEKYTQTTRDDVWIPYGGELISKYKVLYPKTENILKAIVGADVSADWWSRIAKPNNVSDYIYIKANAPKQSIDFISESSILTKGVCLCFCT